ncbi:hypothetical protein FB451DRAFT_471045 [Mycena latifolia]|nr:hypothetical protein FB451DRAFT_471045 [Mycena latifolia]
MTQLSNAGMPLPIPPDFDFDGWMKKPADVIPPADMDLKARNEDNSRAETHNRISLRLTRIYMGAPDKTGLDVGHKLAAYWLYSTGDIQAMVKSTRICDAVGPLPVYLCLMVEQERVNREEAAETEKRDREKERADREKLRAEKEREKAAPILGSMVMLNPVFRTPAMRAPVIIPEIYLLTINHRLHPPLTWFTDERLQYAEHYGHQLHMKKYQPLPPPGSSSAAPDKVMVLDVAKMNTLWGDDEFHSCLSPLGWLQATLNFLAALILLSPAAVDSPGNNFALEFRKHRDFFMNMKNFERDYPLWYPFEREMRQQVMNKVLFDETYYATQVQIILSAFLAVQSMSNPSSLLRIDSPSKRAGDFASPEARKVSKSSYEAQAGNSFRDQSDSFRDSRQARAPEGSNRAPACFICAGSHRLTDHPQGSTTFSDGKPHFACRKGGDIVTTKPFRGPEPRKICGSFNVGKGCQSNHLPHERMHVCTLCGKDHPSLSRHPDCSRVALGNLLP